MRTFLTFCVMALAIAIVGAEDVLEEENVALIQDEKQFQEFYTCMMDEDPCTDKMKKFREVLPIYIATKCGDCSPKEKDLFEKHSKMILEKYPKEFKNIMDKYGAKA